jgi:putative spermidine/putrescine transport system ATP-binding protein
LRALRKTYGHLTVVDDVSLEIPRGEFLTLLGPSGSGKTTLLMMIAGFTAPASGEVVVDGAAMTGAPPEQRNFGMVFQGYALFPHMTVAQNVAYPLRVRHRPRAEIHDRVQAALSLVRMQGFDDRRPAQLSGGQQQRVAIARALVFSPGLLLLDEPLGALDRQLRAEVQAELKALHADIGTTFVYVTHDQEEALSMSDRVAILHGGRLEQVGTPGALYDHPRTRFVADFLGRSNCLTGRVAAREGGTTVLEIGACRVLHRGRIAGAEATVVVRPERMTLALSPLDMENCCPATVAATAYLGSTLQADVETRLGRLTVTCLAWTAPDIAVGQPVWVGWPAEASVALDPDAHQP